LIPLFKNRNSIGSDKSLIKLKMYSLLLQQNREEHQVTEWSNICLWYLRFPRWWEWRGFSESSYTSTKLHDVTCHKTPFFTCISVLRESDDTNCSSSRYGKNACANWDNVSLKMEYRHSRMSFNWQVDTEVSKIEVSSFSGSSTPQLLKLLTKALQKFCSYLNSPKSSHPWIWKH
jgi:hypothetical protein